MNEFRSHRSLPGKGALPSIGEPIPDIAMSSDLTPSRLQPDMLELRRACAATLHRKDVVAIAGSAQRTSPIPKSAIVSRTLRKLPRPVDTR